ncbi:MAG TPA: amino acid synthesis family protein [Actinomycetota bacterium]|nr:amino acid synthesis family protein [Actinomycetota bacterium]
MGVEIRKIVTVVEETRREAGRNVDPPLRKAAAAAVLVNPLAGRYADDLAELIDAGEDLGGMLAQQAVSALGRPAESYGKAGIVGTAGELEHVAALIHPKFGNPLRDAVGGGKSIIPSAKKRGAPGSSIDIPLHYKDAAFVRTHFDAMELCVLDAPHPHEIVIAVALADGGRPHARIGGLQKSEAKGEDGLR